MASWPCARRTGPRMSAALPAAAMMLAALVSGCGGGGGGGGLSATGGGGGPSPPRPQPVDLSRLAASYAGHSDYGAAWGLAQIRAATAYARIAGREGAGTAPGAGARVAVIDNGVDEGHWEFDGLTIRQTCYPADNCGDRTHGTPVASVIAAQRDNTLTLDPPGAAQYNFHGVAWGIGRLDVLSIPLGSGGGTYGGLDSESVDDAVDILAGLFSALRQPVDFVNMSFSRRGLIENYRGRTFGPLYAPAVQTLAQTGKTTGKTILVMSAGNAHGKGCASPEPNCVGGVIDATSPELYAGLPVLEASLRSHMVAVVATDSSGDIASFSNRCGIAAKWCIAAPGDSMWLAAYSPGPPAQRGYVQTRGTSFAAPHVTGGLAVMKHWFRSQLANEKLLERLYLTARVTPDPVSPGGTCPGHLDTDGDLSDCELSSTLGRGLMDLGAATAPVGSTSIALGGRVAQGGAPAASSRMFAGSALGDALDRSLAGRRIAVFDTLGAPFWTDAARFAGRAPAPGPALRLSRWFADMAEKAPEAYGRDGQLRFHMDAPQGAHEGLAFRPASAEAQFGDLGLSAFASTDSGATPAFAGTGGVRAVGADVLGLALAWRPAGGPVSLGAGRIEETETFLGARAEGAFGGLSSSVDFVRAEAGFEAGGWRFDMAAELGRALPEAEGGLLADGGGDAFSTAFSAAAARRLGRGTLRLSLQQPLRVESGRLDLSLPAGRTPEGAVRRERVPVGLESSGRQIDFGIDWTESFVPGAAWRIRAVLSRDPGHDAGRDAEATVLVGMRVGL